MARARSARTRGLRARSKPGKEIHFFDRFWDGREVPADLPGAYARQFPRPEGELTGEWTPRYMHDFWALPLLKAAAPEARILVMLRDPVDRYRSGIAREQRARREGRGAARDRDRRRRRLPQPLLAAARAPVRAVSAGAGPGAPVRALPCRPARPDAPDARVPRPRAAGGDARRSRPPGRQAAQCKAALAASSRSSSSGASRRTPTARPSCAPRSTSRCGPAWALPLAEPATPYLHSCVHASWQWP